MKLTGPVMLDLAGTELTVDDKKLLANDLCGGLILFSRNFTSADQILSLTQSIRAIKQDIIIAVDQEGGRVQRFKQGFSKLPPLSRLGERFEEQPDEAVELAFALGELMAREIQAVGCDISFAPVLDLGNSLSQVIGDRAFATEPQTICLLASAYINGMNAAGMAATGKHFPGHGSVEADSHVALPVDQRDWDSINRLDLVPFTQLNNQLAAVMPAHIIYTKIDTQPAGFSKVWLQEILRQKIGFEGVIFSDDLSMEGAAGMGSFPQRASSALAAGCDMVLVCNNRAAAFEVIDALKGYQAHPDSSVRLNRLKMQTTPQGLKSLQSTSRWQELSALLSTFE